MEFISHLGIILTTSIMGEVDWWSFESAGAWEGCRLSSTDMKRCETRIAGRSWLRLECLSSLGPLAADRRHFDQLNSWWLGRGIQVRKFEKWDCTHLNRIRSQIVHRSWRQVFQKPHPVNRSLSNRPATTLLQIEGIHRPSKRIIEATSAEEKGKRSNVSRKRTDSTTTFPRIKKESSWSD